MKFPIFFNKTFGAIKQFVSNNITFIIVMVCCNLPVLITYENVWNKFELFSYIFAVNTLVALLFSAIPWKRVRLSVKIFIIVLSVLSFYLDAYFSMIYNGVPDQSVIEIVLETNPAEALGYIKAYMMNIWLYVVFVVSLLVLFAIMHYAGNLRNIRGVIAGISLFIMFGTIMALVKIVSEKMNRDMTTYRHVRYEACSVLGKTLFLIKAISSQNAISKMENKTAKPNILENESSIPYVVYILGESFSRHHLGLYGYHLDTTPLLDAKEKQGNLIKFTDVISSEPVTRKSLAKMFTFYRRGMKGEWYENTDLFTILRAAGYHTTWISNQEYSGKHANTAHFYAKRCNENAYTMYRQMNSYTLSEPHDETMLPYLDSTLIKSHKKNFVLLHMIGAHQLYSARYPESRRKFTTAMEFGSNDMVKSEKADYDNAVLYNDSVINEIINRFENKNAIVVFTPDHGEDVMEINLKAPGHYELNPNVHMVEIPMMIWVSNKFQAAYPELVARIRRSKDRPFMTDDMIHTLLDLIQIRTKEFNERLSLINDKYDTKRVRYCGDKIYQRKEKRLSN